MTTTKTLDQYMTEFNERADLFHASFTNSAAASRKSAAFYEKWATEAHDGRKARGYRIQARKAMERAATNEATAAKILASKFKVEG